MGYVSDEITNKLRWQISTFKRATLPKICFVSDDLGVLLLFFLQSMQTVISSWQAKKGRWTSSFSVLENRVAQSCKVCFWQLVWVISHNQETTRSPRKGIIMARITKVVGGGDGGLVVEAPRPGVCGEGLCSASAWDRILQHILQQHWIPQIERILSKCMK